MIQDEAKCEVLLEEIPVEKERRVQVKCKVNNSTWRDTQPTGINWKKAVATNHTPSPP